LLSGTLTGCNAVHNFIGLQSCDEQQRSALFGRINCALANRGYLVNKKNNKDNNDTTPSLDLSFAYGTSVMKHLTESDMKALAEQEAANEASTGDTTIRTITSLYTGKRNIVGITDDSEDDGTA
jgi:hypothetical protein